ncbi:DNA topoisomerase I [Candidatus Nanohalococcus occultus]|uniref:DNA topoisomerase I n=1 Tax=Candidatus Nanohalococcus occultus TaxID=2978047 RepID=UPI0039E1F367
MRLEIMETTVMIGEKPKVASKLANALGNYSTKTNRGVKNYVIETDERRIIIAPAVGHIFNLEQISEGWDYPVFDVEWRPIFETSDSSDYVKKYYNNLRDQIEKADTYINACDFDLEGSVIGANIIKHMADPDEERIERMKFSTLTQSDLQEAFDNLEGFDKGMTDAGITRHTLDFYYGVNVSRALMQAVRENNRYKTLSTGRVQGPTLKILADKEREIRAFEPDDYWEIFLKHSEFDAKLSYGSDDRIWDEDEANGIFLTVKDEGRTEVTDIDINNYSHNPPIPFNLTGLQSEASSQFNISPKKTQSIAQTLYENSLISYPRTESQKLPPKIGYKDILGKLKSQDSYEDLAKKVMKKDSLSTTQGKKKDDAHPAIYPTGEHPSGLSKQERKVYDLIVKRFFAVFGKAAKRRSLTMTLTVEDYEFQAKSKITVERNWFDLYDPYVKVSEAALPELEVGDVLDVEGFDLEDKETQPPQRYSQSRIVNKLEKENLGTKATRASTIDRLYNRNYIEGDPINVTDLGLAIVDTLEDHIPDLLSPDLTREFEEKMESIRQGEETSEGVIEKAREDLDKMLGKFKDQEKEIGAELVNTIDDERKRRRKLGPCHECEEQGREDGMLRIIKSKGSSFVGCRNYPDCENTYPLPNTGKVNSTDQECSTCGKPVIYVERKKKKSYSMCVDPDCPSKDDW